MFELRYCKILHIKLQKNCRMSYLTQIQRRTMAGKRILNDFSLQLRMMKEKQYHVLENIKQKNISHTEMNLNFRFLLRQT